MITSSSRMGLGNAGSVYIRADNISLNKDSSSSQNVVISTQTGDPRAPLRMGNGNAGNIDISTPGYFLITNGAQIISGTSTLNGAAGSISINAGKLIIDGYYGDSSIPSNINARAYKISGNSSSGQTGIITIHANEMILSNSGQITIQNDATVANPSLLTPTSISITADRITLNDASISAASTGNVAASNIVVNFTDLLHLEPSSITTSAQNGNGGAITINGGRLIWLDNSQITTSVLGATGNGGDISINADGMLMATGFIQANTAATGAAGGLVDIHVPTLLASGSNVFVGGSTQQVFAPDQFGLNVIQAAAPDGVSGEINLSAPVLDVSGSMATLGVPAMGAVPLGRNPCATLAGSSLNTTGIDILPPAARDSLSLDLPVDTPVQSGGSIPQGAPRGVASSGTECRP